MINKSKKPGKPAGRPEDFRQVRAGTARARIIEGAGRRYSIDRVASYAGVDRRMLMVHLFCLRRDCAIGYELAGDRVVLVFPEGKTAQDAVKSKD